MSTSRKCRVSDRQMRLSLLARLATLASGFASQAPPPVWPAPPTAWQSVECTTTTACSLVEGRSATATAWGSFSNQINSTGWSVLAVTSREDAPGAEQAFAAGYLEGALTHQLISLHAPNVWSLNFNDSSPYPQVPPAEASWVSDNVEWMHSAAASSDSGYSMHVGFLLAQLKGLTAGYNAHRAAGEPLLSENQMMMLSLVDGDLGDVQSAIGAATVQHDGLTHCSAMVKRLSNGNVLIGHTNWDSYVSMLRIVKYFNLPLPAAAAHTVSMDSYPGVLYSETDFYRTSAGLTITETSLDNQNSDLWSLVVPQTMLTWARAMLANRLASNGDEWTEIASRHNSGTCNNQWIVLDNTKSWFILRVHYSTTRHTAVHTASEVCWQVKPGPLPAGTLWVSETMPGHTERADMTSSLNGRSSSWFSFNIPFFSSIANAGDADFWSAPRELMFERMRTESPVDSLESFIAFLRYNNRSDPLAEGDACNGVSARCDLNDHSSPRYHMFGAQDVKVAEQSVHHANNNSVAFWATLSPTWDLENNPPFAWSKQAKGVRRPRGHPDVFDFKMFEFTFENT